MQTWFFLPPCFVQAGFLSRLESCELSHSCYPNAPLAPTELPFLHWGFSLGSPSSRWLLSCCSTCQVHVVVSNPLNACFISLFISVIIPRTHNISQYLLLLKKLILQVSAPKPHQASLRLHLLGCVPGNPPCWEGLCHELGGAVLLCWVLYSCQVFSHLN